MEKRSYGESKSTLLRRWIATATYSWCGKVVFSNTGWTTSQAIETAAAAPFRNASPSSCEICTAIAEKYKRFKYFSLNLACSIKNLSLSTFAFLLLGKCLNALTVLGIGSECGVDWSRTETLGLDELHSCAKSDRTDGLFEELMEWEHLLFGDGSVQGTGKTARAVGELANADSGEWNELSNMDEEFSYLWTLTQSGKIIRKCLTWRNLLYGLNADQMLSCGTILVPNVADLW